MRNHGVFPSILRFARSWCGESATDVAARSGWERYEREFGTRQFKGAIEPWRLLGGGNETMPWELPD